MNSDVRLTKLLEMLKNDPEDSFLLYAVAHEYLQANPVQAEPYLETLLTQHPLYLPTYYQAGLFYENVKKDTLKAIEVLNGGLLLAKEQQNTKALNELREVLQSIED